MRLCHSEQVSMLWQLVRGARTDKEIDRARRGTLSVATLSAVPTMTGPRSRTQQDGRVLPRAELQGCSLRNSFMVTSVGVREAWREELYPTRVVELYESFPPWPLPVLLLPPAPRGPVALHPVPDARPPEPAPARTAPAALASPRLLPVCALGTAPALPVRA